MVAALEVLLTPFSSLFVRWCARAAERGADRWALVGGGKGPLGRAIASAAAVPYRDRFTRPLVFGAPARSGLGWLSWHSPAARRQARLDGDR
jgi:Zn-dependent protease with chaperone function